jgi:ABC-2 type transport system permease protein
MKNSWIIAVRELKERVGSRSFMMMSILGPMLVLGLIYLLFTLGGQSKQHWKVLVSDSKSFMDSKIVSNKSSSLTYFFADQYIEIEDFADNPRFQEYDALVEVNEKVFTNKVGFVFYREKPSFRMQTRIQYDIERRLEEVLVSQVAKFSVAEFRKIKQPLTLSFKNVYDPKDEASNMAGWVGYFFGALIILFVFLFGMTILRSVSMEKSNRIVEVLLGVVRPKELMLGKISGIGMAAFLQFLIWSIIISLGLYGMREMIFHDLLDASSMQIQDLAKDASSYQEQFFAAKEYNQFVDLIYSRIQFDVMIGYFLLFFVCAYLFYGSFFAIIGATSGSESDGQQFVLPLIFLLGISLYGGYYAMVNPEASLTTYLAYIPFTAPIVTMVKLGQGYTAETIYQLYISLSILLLSAFYMLHISSRLYGNGVLAFGHRLRLIQLFKWLKK